MRLSNSAFYCESKPSARVRTSGAAFAGWLSLLALGLFLGLGPKGFGQTMTLSAPSSNGTVIDNAAVVFSISGETGTIGTVQVVMTYLSGPSTESIGSIWTMTMFSISATQSFSFNPSTATSSALFRAVTQVDPDGNLVTQLNSSGNPVTPPAPDGVYSFYAQYTRGLTGAVVRTNTASPITVDTGALPATFSHTPIGFNVDAIADVVHLGFTPVVINPATDVITRASHGYSANAAVRISGTNLPSTTTYYVSVSDSNTFKLATTSGGSTYADITPGTNGTITSTSGSTAVTIDPTTDGITLANHGLAANAAVTLSETNLPTTKTYYVSVVDSNTFKLATTSGGSTYADITPGTSGAVRLTSATTPVAHLLEDGTAVKISGSNLAPTTTYYVSLIDSSSFKLTTTLGGSTYAKFWNTTSGTISSLSAPTAIAIDPATEIITLANHGFAANAVVSISGTNLLPTTPYYVSVLTSNTFKLATTSGGSTFADIAPGTSGTIRLSAVTIDPATDVITLASHGIAANAPVTISGTNLSPNKVYFVSVLTTNTFKLATTSGGSTFADFLPLTSALIRPFSSSTPAALSLAIAPGTDVVTLTGHGLAADTAVTISGTNLSPSKRYYLSVIDANTFKLVTTSLGSTVADFTSTATSSGTITRSEPGDVRTLGTNLAPFYISIPESYASTTAKVTFTGHTTVVVTMPNGVREQSFVLDRSNMVLAGFTSTSTTVPDDTYTVSFAYRDLSNHNSTPVTLPYMLYDAATLIPSFTSLVNNAAITDGSTIAYTLPEAPYGGTVKLTFSNGTTTTVIPLTNAASGTFTFSRSLYAATIPTGTYTVTLSYADIGGNPVASTSVTGVTVTVTSFSTATDTDGDGLNDAAEVALVALGFDWQIAQPALVTAFLNNALYTQAQMTTNRTAGQTDVTSNPGAYSLYSLTQLQNLQVGTPVITKDTVSGKWKLTIGLQKSTDLTNYTAFPFISAGTSINGSGDLEFLFTVPEDNAFFRLTTF